MPWSSHEVVHGRHRVIVLLLAGVLALQTAAGTGQAYLAGFERTRAVLAHPHWPWLALVVTALAVSFAGYCGAYRGVLATVPGWTMTRRHLWAVALAGFGGFFAHGATPIDLAASRAGGADRRDAGRRVAAFGGLEYGILAAGGCGCAISVLVRGLAHPTPDVTLPWSVLPLPGYVLAFWLAGRSRLPEDDRRRVRRWFAQLFASIRVIRGMFARPHRHLGALVGMAVFWLGDLAAAWAAMALFGSRMDPAAFVVGFATGLVFTRRTGPMAGSGLLAIALPAALWYSGGPFAPAVCGIFVYQLLAVWLPLPVTLATRQLLRDVMAAAPQTRGGSGQPGATKHA